MDGAHNYHAYLLDNGGHIVLRVDINCYDDETAKQKAEALVDDHDIELWDGREKSRCSSVPSNVVSGMNSVSLPLEINNQPLYALRRDAIKASS